MAKLTVPFEEVTDEELKNLLASCPNSWRGDQGFQNWCKSLVDLAGSNTPAAAPVITSLTPDTATAGAADTPLAIAGTGFVEGSTVATGAGDLATTFTSATELGATIPAAELAAAGTLNLTVRNPDTQTSAAAPFTVT
jgi:hypothetical protein